IFILPGRENIVSTGRSANTAYINTEAIFVDVVTYFHSIFSITTNAIYRYFFDVMIYG
ncbi:hypothetical protein HMPREF0758_2053, partial [Serratia odorifera DSM 4582]